MKKIPSILIVNLLFASMWFTACDQQDQRSDAYGNFEATEVSVSSEANGKLLFFDVEEGGVLKAGQQIGLVDTTMFDLQRQALKAKRSAIATKTGNIVTQIDVLNQEIKVLETEKSRVESLLKDEAATPKQLDDINGRISVVKSKIKSIESQNSNVISEVRAIDVQMKQIAEQISKSSIVNPIDGTVLVKMAEPSEVVNFGKKLYKIAALDELYLRAYLTGSQLSQVKIGQEVKVLIDKNATEQSTLTGTVSWISSVSEFTPKIVQTREERVNLVYAFKVKVKNDGSLKIGMPGEVLFSDRIAEKVAE